MTPKFKLLSITVGLFTLFPLSGFSQIKTTGNSDSISKAENQPGQVSEWKEQAPTSTGWRTARPGMTIDELISALPDAEARKKKVKYTDGTTGQEANLGKKVRIDGLDYKVSFLFDSAGHLITITFHCNAKVRKETFSKVTETFTGLLGEPAEKQANSSYDGSQDLILWKWKQTNSVLSILSGTLRQGIIVVGRLINISIYYEGGR